MACPKRRGSFESAPMSDQHFEVPVLRFEGANGAVVLVGRFRIDAGTRWLRIRGTLDDGDAMSIRHLEGIDCGLVKTLRIWSQASTYGPSKLLAQRYLWSSLQLNIGRGETILTTFGRVIE